MSEVVGSLQRRRTGKRWLLVGLALCGITVLITGVVFWMSLQYRPGWFRPPVVDEALLQRARADSARLYDSTSDNIVRREGFDLVLTETMLNEWLAALPRLWPEVETALPTWLNQWAVHFEDEQIKIGVLYDKDGWRAVLSMTLQASVSEDGHTLSLVLGEVRSGSLAVPRSLLERTLQPIVDNASQRGNAHKPADQTIQEAFGNIRSLDDLERGLRFRNEFVWPNGKRRFRFGSLSIEEGELRARIEPL